MCDFASCFTPSAYLRAWCKVHKKSDNGMRVMALKVGQGKKDNMRLHIKTATCDL